jgi:hypothetical protein
MRRQSEKESRLQPDRWKNIEQRFSRCNAQPTIRLMNFDNQTGELVVTPLGGSDAENTPEGATTLLPALVVKIHKARVLFLNNDADQ